MMLGNQSLAGAGQGKEDGGFLEKKKVYGRRPRGVSARKEIR